MHLEKLSLLNFKNYAEAEFVFDERVNCFVGDNGEGKTNLLDAIHYLSMCKSYFNPIDSQNILYEAPFFVVQGRFQRASGEENIYCGLKRNLKKQFKRNQKEYTRLAEHIGLLPVVMISPSDTGLISSGSEDRRKLVDSIISQYDAAYLDNLIRYNQVLTQRNALLKQMSQNRYNDSTSLDAWDEQMVTLGNQIYEKREEFLLRFIPIFKNYFGFITEEKERVNLIYQSQLQEKKFGDLLAGAREKDRQYQYSTTGIHKDDLVFTIRDFSLKKTGSQGQQKSFLIALKLAQFDFIRMEKKMKPILLLDDIFDKLDIKRVRRIMELVNGDGFGQIFITDAHPERVSSVFSEIKKEAKTFLIKNGGGTEYNFLIENQAVL
jgi:DNA replication and repair protein RecF